VRHRKCCRLSEDRYKAALVEGARANYYARLRDYIHLSPFRGGFAESPRMRQSPRLSLEQHRWRIRFPAAPTARIVCIGEEFLSWPLRHGGRTAQARGISRSERRRRGKEKRLVLLPEWSEGRMSHLRRGWYWGRQEFAQWELQFADAQIRKGKCSRLPERPGAPRPRRSAGRETATSIHLSPIQPWPNGIGNIRSVH
jgi:putative transposase